jgi:hypothetical protein
MKMRSRDRSEKCPEGRRNLAKQFISEYDIVVRSTFHPHTDAGSR